ncbi:phosphoribosylglycinamide formyltransferase [Xanthocytophaga agilis]|uniref:Phosphoribosylglycinamide formyltransferase n=1 Tax=Xanthocytophaga agilis TaxID=3048010 RepID=A0AAE3R5A8_9BACT|nr:phosphoribosylglycinamide formyltransferase [Xanthocytophaga agilis]MDJ1503931.1 phosphoribosylglycinamide formyltransferase [Xanthocytophaga agilis]
MTSIAIFASGSGSNAQKIMEYFDNHPSIQVKLVLSNKEDAPVLLRAANFMVPTYVFDRKTFYETTKVEEELASYKIDYIVLAGFLWLIPLPLIHTYPNKIINIHPALLPKYGGKGMYGMKVHEAVVQAKETETGITIHLINEEYDKGAHLFQISCVVEANDTPERIAEKVHALEHTHFPKVIEEWILKTRS